MSAPELKYLPIAQLTESSTNYRRSHDEAKHQELVASIRQHGILTPLVVRQVTQDPNWIHEVAAGHRRLRAARVAGVEMVPVTVRAMDDREFAEIMITENLQRVDPDPLDEADAYQEMINSLGYDVATLAVKFGKSETYVRQRLVLTRIVPEVRTALSDGAIELGHAVLLARVDEARQVELLRTELLASYRMSRTVFRETVGEDGLEEDEVEDAVVIDAPRTKTTVGELRVAMSRQLLPLAPVKWDRNDATLVPSSGSCTACPKRTGANPALFEEFDPADDRCPDAACYGAKKAAYLEARVQACRSQAPKLVVISTSYTRKLKTVAGLPVLRHHVDWAPATAGKRGAVPAVVVESLAGALDDWTDVGTLRDVQLVKAEKATAGKGATSGKTTDWDAVRRTQREADARFWVGLRGVVQACRDAGRFPDNRQPLLAAFVLHGAEFDHQLCTLLREELGDPTLEHEQLHQLSDETLTDASMLLAASFLCLDDLDTPSWYDETLPTVESETGTYPVPIGLSQLAHSLGVNGAAAWREAIDAHVTAGAA